MEYRLDADHEAYHVIDERNFDPRWSQSDLSIELDPRSRYFDVYDPDCPPIPLDDPTSHAYMHCVNGISGWKHWHDFGDRFDIENPGWQEALGQSVELTESGAVQLDTESAIFLAYLHSPFHQTQLETLYRSALDVTRERFNLETQFFGGYDTVYRHNGKLIPASLVPVAGGFVVAPPVEGIESNRLTIGRPNAGNPVIQARRRFATAGELLAGFANSFVFEFTGGNANLSASLANISFIQPLLRGAGKDVALESLTFAERALLANLRAYSQFRQGFYTQIAIGELGVTGPRRGGPTTSLQSFSGSNFVGGYLGLLRQLQQIRNSEDNLRLQLRTLKRLEAYLDVGVIDLVQVDQFRQSVENSRAGLLLSRNNYELDLDRFKTDTLGLPPDLPIELNDQLIHQFQLITPDASRVLDAIVERQELIGATTDNESLDAIISIMNRVAELVDEVNRQFDAVRADVLEMETFTDTRTKLMTEQERQAFDADRLQLNETLVDLEEQFVDAATQIHLLQDQLSNETRTATIENVVVWLSDVLRIMQRLVLVQARARLEVVNVPEIELEPHDAFQIALSNRLDFMNGRAALVDDWRLIQVSADALQSVLNITGNGDVRTARNNPLSFRAPTANVRLGIEFDAPLTRLIERNNYRESLINYQQSRRDFIQSRDGLHLGLRALLRQIEQLRQNLEIQRRAVTIAIRRVDLTQSRLAAPVPPPRPGQRAAQFNPTTAINLESAQSSLRDTQNNFLSAWLSYYAARLRLYRELGVMAIDSDGNWIENELPTSSPKIEENTDPPEIPTDWIEMATMLDEDELVNTKSNGGHSIDDRIAASHGEIEAEVNKSSPQAKPAHIEKGGENSTTVSKSRHSVRN